MKTPAWCAVLLWASLACADRVYDNNEITLLTRLDAKEMCSCVFVVGQTQEFCREYVRLGIPVPGLAQGLPVPVLLRVDSQQKTTHAQVGLHVASARWRGDRVGCVLE